MNANTPSASASVSVASRFRKPALVLAAVLALILVLLAFAWLALPGIVQTQAQTFIAERTGHRLSLARPEINPLALSVRLRDLRLDDPAGAPLAGFRELFVDLSAASLAGRTLTFDAIALDGLALNLVQQADGLNWAPLLKALESKEAPADPPAAPPRIDIHRLALTGAAVDIADRRTAPAFATRIEPLEIELTEVSTLPNDSGSFHVAAKTAFGAEVDWRGSVALNPVASAGTLALRGVDLARLAPLLQGKLPVQPPAGVAAVSAAYRAALGDGRLDLALEQIAAQLEGFTVQRHAGERAPRLALDKLELADGRFDLGAGTLALPGVRLDGARLEAADAGKGARVPVLALPRIELADAQVNLDARQATLAAVTLQGGRLALRRDAGGRLDLPDVIDALVAAPAGTAGTPPTAPAATPAAAGPAWRYRIERVALSGFGAALRDESTAPPLELALDNIGVEVTGVSENLKAPLPLKAGLDVKSGGRLDAAGRIVPAEAAVDLQLKLADLALKPAQPFVTRAAAIDLAGGRVSAEGRVRHEAGYSGYRGSFALTGLALTQENDKEILLGWKSLATRQLEATPGKLDIGELRLDGLDGKLIIYSDKTINLKRVMRTPQESQASAAAGQEPAKAGAEARDAASPAPTPAAAPAPAAPPAFAVNIDRLRFRDGKLTFGDYSLLIPFETRIHTLRGSVSGLTTTPGAPGQLELDGEVDDYGMARAVGQVDLFDPTGYTDLKVTFRNLEMTRLTPYMATFAGRKIDSGKLSLDLEYKIKQRQLQGENQLVIERLALGERVESPTARSLPLDLAIAILSDSDGRIDLGLPISGNLDDPQFSYGAIVWKAITNVLAKIVTAPFRALGALFGSGAEKIDSVAFESGAARLTPPEREKLARIAGVLNKRPGLALAVQGTWSEADRVALQERQLRRTVAQKAGLDAGERGDPGPLSTRAPKVQAALEDLYGERVGKADLAALKEGFRSANPGQLEENVAGRMMSRLSGLMREKKTLAAGEVEQLKGADFHGVLFERLRARESVGDEALQELAARRAEHALESLKGAGAPADRIKAGAVEKAEPEGRETALKLGLDKAGK